VRALWVAAWSAALILMVAFAGALASSPGKPPEMDQYGGYREIRSPGGGTGFFRVEKIGARWIFVTPEGHAFWLRAVYGVDTYDGGAAYRDVLMRKYSPKNDPNWKPDWFPWGAFVGQTSKRLKAWGFNCIGENSAIYAMHGVRSDTNPEPIPFIRMIRPAYYAIQPKPGVKNLVAGTDPSVFHHWRGWTLPDLFDPAFATFVQGMANGEWGTYPSSLEKNPWLLGTTTDDADQLPGIKGGPHLGWFVAITAPTQDGKPVYSKLAFRDFLKRKYQTLEALNGAWKARYTTWESDGAPWPQGKGVLDESGKNRWFPKDLWQAADAGPVVKADLDAFAEFVADKYYSTTVSALKAYTPKHLVFGPAAILSQHASEATLRAAARHVDVLQVNALPNNLDVILKVYEITHKPIFVWTTLIAQKDSPLAGSPAGDWNGAQLFATQAERGMAYADYIRALSNLRAADGTYPVVGIDWWAWTDKAAGGESTNFGLVTNQDNAYDGKEAVQGTGADRWGYPTGREKRDYGDFISAVVKANAELDMKLQSELGSGSRAAR